MPTYKDVVSKFAEAGCELYTTEEEFKSWPKTSHGICKFKASCGHDNTVTLTNFLCKGSGKICKSCMAQRVREIGRSQKDPHLCEYESFCIISKFIQDKFEVKKTNEGCMADMIIKPKNVDADEWLMIQLKSTQCVCHDLYTFKMNNNSYPDCVILCICIQDNRMWVFDNHQISVKNNLNIGLTDKSKYSSFEESNSTINHCLLAKYRKYKKVSCDEANVPKSKFQQQEQVYRRKRETEIPFLPYVYPVLDNRVYDFMINNYKIQEKVSSIAKKHSNNPIHVSCLYRSCKGETRQKCYNKGDNDFYWIWKKDTDVFYIIPDKELVERKYIQVDGNLDDKKKTFSLASWTDKYKYTLGDVDLQEKLTKLFEPRLVI